MATKTKPPTFATRLRALREHAGISAYELAKRSGVSAPMIRNIEAGTNLPGWEVVCKLADALGVSVAEFRKALAGKDGDA